MRDSQGAVNALQHELPQLDWITDGPRVARLSQDFSWFSPVLKRQLEGKVADIVVRPVTEGDLRSIVQACVAKKLPITIRGSGTGNYGQTTPLDGGVVIDMTNFNALIWARPGVARAQAGMRLSQLEKLCAPSGMEMRCMPSTYRSATLGGLFGGGFGGVGSINHGPLAAPGNVLGVRAMTIEAEPKFIELRGAEALRMHHLWGTNGLVLEIELAMAPVHPWVEVIVAFDGFENGLDFGNELAHAPGIVKREIAFFGDPLPTYFTALADHLPAGCHAVFALVSESSEDAMKVLAERHHGTLTYRSSERDAPAPSSGRNHKTLLEFTWNHTTLNALKVDPTLTYLQTGFVPGKHVGQIVEMERLLAGEVLMHVEFLRSMDGLVTCSGLQLVRFSSEARLNEIMQIHRDNDIRINNPHVYIVEDGKAGGALPAEVLAMKRMFDPHSLLNPGKLRDYPVVART